MNKHDCAKCIHSKKGHRWKAFLPLDILLSKVRERLKRNYCICKQRQRVKALFFLFLFITHMNAPIIKWFYHICIRTYLIGRTLAKESTGIPHVLSLPTCFTCNNHYNSNRDVASLQKAARFYEIFFSNLHTTEGDRTPDGFNPPSQIEVSSKWTSSRRME